MSRAMELAPLRCERCGERPGGPAWRCPRCGGPLEFDEPGSPAGPAAPRLAPPPPGRFRWPWEASIWRWEPLLPEVPAEARVTLGEGATPLVPLAGEAEGGEAPEAEGGGIWLKLDFLQPSGSFKDRGAAFLVSYLKAQGVREVRDDSSGNAGVALAAYAARAGMRCHVFVPSASSEGKLAQLRLLGATVHRLDGGRDAARAAAQAEEAAGFYASHNWHPAFLAGLTTLGYELAEEVASLLAPGQRWHAVLPAGHGSLVLALGRAWRRLGRGRAAAAPAAAPAPAPVLWAVQAEGDAPLARALEEGLPEPTEEILAAPRRPTAAEGIAGARPVRGREVLEHLRRSGGGVVTVTEEELAAALLRLLGQGLLVEPTAAAALAGALRLRREGRVAAGEPVVAVLTGSGLKAPAALERLLAGDRPGEGRPGGAGPGGERT
ncbi:MAG: pyridoxal-phosphate dependent enzyme [Bacillota bacterium]|nr:pyridoxal-phosphate dependent enzyme [Bacillota bacterium]